MKSGEKRQQSVIIDDTAMQAEVKTEYLQNSFRVRFLKEGKKPNNRHRWTQPFENIVGLQKTVQYSQHNQITMQNNSRVIFIIQDGMRFNIKKYFFCRNLHVFVLIFVFLN